ncbi:MAG: UDP-N-acetylmuramoyl-L-alanyl-D-glutamate--2,6-diaminopimelate ligase, partial [Microthrixaceae bacterium]
MSRLADLVALLSAEPLDDTAGATEVADVVADSRRVVAGSLFCCVPGERHDGHDHAAAAVASGAVALLCERRLPLDVPQLLVSDVRAAMGPAAAEVHGHPARSLDVVGVTGTNGKTTVVSMIEAILTADGRSARSIGTLTGARTTPEAPDLQRQLAELVADGVSAVAMEVSSHALAMHRVDGIEFAVAVFTNLGTDHLDFHGTPEAYFSAKALLFEAVRSRRAVLNVDDIRGRLLRDAAEIPVVSVSLDDVGELRTDAAGTTFDWRGVQVHLPMVGRHNVSNALLAAEACTALGVDVETVVAGLGALATVPGRFEMFGAPVSPGATDGATDGPVAVVDYAHTADALEQVLIAARDLADDRGRVTVVFGCGGDRDRSKRPAMAEVATRLADRVIVTSDNPRSEDPARIADEVVAGAVAPVEHELDSAAAIAQGLAGARPRDGGGVAVGDGV